MKARIYALLEVIFIAMFIFSAYKLVTIYVDYSKGDEIYEESEDSYFEVPQNNTDKDKDFKLDIDKLQKTNKDALGWIYIEDTPVSYPLLQTDNNQYYLKRTYNNVHSAFGSIFIDYRSSADLNDKNTLIYGHNTKNGSMFGSLKKYKKEEYLRNHPYIYIVYKDKTYKYQIFTAFTALTSNRVYTLDFESAADFRDWIRYVHSQSEVKVPDIKPTGKEKIITLSTCTSRRDDERFVVLAVQVDVMDNGNSIELGK